MKYIDMKLFVFRLGRKTCSFVICPILLVGSSGVQIFFKYGQLYQIKLFNNAANYNIGIFYITIK